MSFQQRREEPLSNEKGYPWLFFYPRRAWTLSVLVTLLVIGTAVTCYFWYSRISNDLAPDSSMGLGFAIAGTLSFLLATIGYTFWRRKRWRGTGKLNTALHWHIFFALIGSVLILLHSFGNFNARTGTYALYSLIALLVSGFVGRALDHLLPRLIAREVDALLTEDGEDRLEYLFRHGEFLYPTPPHRSRGLSRFQTSSQWISPQSMPLPVVMARARQQIAAISHVQRAMQRELCYRYILRYWRLLHLCLALCTIALIIWHLIYVAQLLLPEVLH